MRLAPLALVFAALAGCSSGADPAPASGSARPAAGPPGALATWSRDGLPPHPAGSSSTQLPVSEAVDPSALDELLRAAPKPSTSAPLADAGRPAIGSDTGVAAPSTSASAPLPTADTPTPRVTVGKVSHQQAMAAAAVERAARAQLYWPLVQKCRDPEGKILPPDAVHLEFAVDPDGYIVSSTITSEARQPRFTDAARCMRRELSTSTFRAPASGRGMPRQIKSDVPSVD